MKHSEPNRADTESQKAIDPLRHQRVFNSLLLPPGCTNWGTERQSSMQQSWMYFNKLRQVLVSHKSWCWRWANGRGRGDVQWEWAAVRRLWSIKLISSTDWMSWGISYARAARGRQVKEETRQEVKAEEEGTGGGGAAIDAKVFGQKTAETVRRCLRWQNLRYKTFQQSKNFGSASLFIHRVEVVVAVARCCCRLLQFAAYDFGFCDYLRI